MKLPQINYELLQKVLEFKAIIQDDYIAKYDLSI